MSKKAVAVADVLDDEDVEEIDEVPDYRTEEEQRVMGPGSEVRLTDTRAIIDGAGIAGVKGRVYTPTNFFSEMTAEHREYILSQLAPVIPMIMEAMEAEDEKDFIKRISKPEFVVPIIGMLQNGGTRDIRALAALYLPEDDREFREADVEKRMGLFKKWTLMREWEVISGFFSGLSGGAPGTSPGSSAVARPKNRRGPFNTGR